MKKWAFLIFLLFAFIAGQAQHFELLDKQESYQLSISEQARIPIKIKNSSTKAQFYVIRKVSSDFGSSQKGYFCLDKNCLDPAIDEFSKRIEPGETLSGLVYIVEGGLQNASSIVKLQVFPKGLPSDAVEYSVAITVSEKTRKPVIFQSKDITIEDVYPNPVQDIAYMHYRLVNENIKAKLVIHNILGNPIKDIELTTGEDRAKIMVEELVSGIYFYTLYLDNTGVLTRKLIIRK
jgi:hypothetical protein